MRKISLLIIAVAACVLMTAATASAADRYAFPGGNDTNIATCGPADNCNLESAMNTTLVADGSKVLAAPGTYSVTTPLALFAAGATLLGTGESAADVVINSAYSSDPAMTLDNGTEAENFTLNTVTSQSSKGGLNVVSGNVDHVAVTAAGQYANACTGRSARFVHVLCRATGEFGSAFRSTAAASLSFTFINSTLVPGAFGYGFAGTTLTDSNEMSVEMFSTIIVEGSGHPIMLGKTSGGPASEFTAEYSNYPCTQIVLDQVSGQSCLPPEGATNQAEAPIFKDPGNGDFTPAADSPTVDAGSTTGLTGDKDLAENARVQGAAADIGAFESSPVVVTPPVIVPPVVIPPVLDVIKPTLTITKKPKSRTTSKKLNVTFKASETATYTCKLDSAKFKSCKSPYKKSKLKLGKHKLQIKATDAAGNVSSTKTIKWTVKAP